MASLSIDLPDETLASLRSLAVADEPPAAVIRRAIEAFVADHADARIARVRAADETDEIISFDEMRKRLAAADRLEA